MQKKSERCKDPAIAYSSTQKKTLNSMKDICIHEEASNTDINEQNPHNIIPLEQNKKDFNQQFENSFSKKEIINLQRNYESKQFRTFVKEKIHTFFYRNKDRVEKLPEDEIMHHSVSSHSIDSSLRT